MRVILRSAVLALGAVFVAGATLNGQDLPVVRSQNGASQLIVHGKPLLALGGELGNSSAGTAAQADTVLPKLARMHFNTVLMPVAWNEIEPEEGRFDFSVADHWIDVARAQNLRLVFLWFGSWKNAYSEYAPQWVLADTKRFPRVISAEGLPLDILSPLGEETLRADSRAFAALMRHLRERDAGQQTVLMVQVENELGYLGVGGRDRSEAANRLFQAQVPAQLTEYLKAHAAQLPKEINPAGHTWKQVFGSAADEAFMAWQYGLFVNQVAKAGKAEYALPMYMNAQLPADFEQAGEYPSGGPYPQEQAVYRAAAPSIDFYSPDIYWPNFAEWVNRYKSAGNPVFVPEARLDVAPWNALFLYGEARGFGFSPFAVDDLSDATTTPPLASLYGVLSSLSDEIVGAQAKQAIRGLVLHEDSARPSQTVSLGGYLFRAALSRSWPSRQIQSPHGAMIVIERAPGEFLIVGSGLTVNFQRDPDTDDKLAGIASIEELAYTNGQWATHRVLNGDQSDQGRALLMDPHEFRVYKVKLYSHARHD